MDNYKKICWLSSFPKSGNTWVRCLLSAYLEGKVDINQLKGAYIDTDTYCHQLVAPQPLNKLSNIEYVMSHGPALMHMLHMLNLETVPMKTHFINGNVQGIPFIPLPVTSSAVYLIRDPRDIVISYSKHLGLTIDETINLMNNPGGTVDSGDLYHYVSTWHGHVQSWTEQEDFPVRVVKYENLLADTKTEFRHILTMLGYQNDLNNNLELAVELCGFQHLKKQESQRGFLEKPLKEESFFREGKSGNWENILSNDQIKLIEKNHGETMKKWGYL